MEKYMKQEPDRFMPLRWYSSHK